MNKTVMESPETQNVQKPPPRRTFLKVLVGSLNGLIALMLGVPGMGYLLTPLFKKEGKAWIPIGRENAFDEEDISKAVFQYVSVTGYSSKKVRAFAWIKTEHQRPVIAFSPKCTHMGCNVAWNPRTNHFECPCHGGTYDAEGNVIAGPPPRPLDRYPIKIENGRVFIQIVEK
ncbi:MAG: ubiquinol-cytochrome c reductase iron-sulfur subunit [Calditrichaeota bacterium]|nr:MAG: ubiquinol-cytochrome c reductase iron-sulfur subunit [Calditrichota bacterium]